MRVALVTMLVASSSFAQLPSASPEASSVAQATDGAGPPAPSKPKSARFGSTRESAAIGTSQGGVVFDGRKQDELQAAIQAANQAQREARQAPAQPSASDREASKTAEASMRSITARMQEAAEADRKFLEAATQKVLEAQRAESASTPGNDIYHWVDSRGVVHYSTYVPEAYKGVARKVGAKPSP